MSNDPSQAGHDILVVIHSQDASRLGTRRELEPRFQTITLGRHSTNTFVLTGDGISRHHARVEYRNNDGWWVVDLGSSNGTYVNDQQIESVRLQCGDVIRIGTTIVRYSSAESERGIVEVEYTGTPLDGLTKAHHRRHLLEQIEHQIACRESTQGVLTLALFDLEHFKALNDVVGHLAGDQVLREIVALMRPFVRDDELLARYGGDVFAVLLPGTSRADAVVRAETIRAAVEEHPFRLEGTAVSLTLALGVAEVGEDTRSAERLVRAAEQQLYADKLTRRERRRNSATQVSPGENPEGSIEVVLGLCASRGSRTIDAGAGVGEGVLAVADGLGGHSTGWLASRIAARVPVEHLAKTASSVQFVGAAEVVPDNWGWAGAMQSREAGERLYQQCVDELG